MNYVNNFNQCINDCCIFNEKHTFYDIDYNNKAKDTLAAIKSKYPSAVKYVKVDGGYVAFDTWDDYNVWKKQK